MIIKVPWRNVPGLFRPRNFVMKRPWDKKVLGTKQSLDKTSSENLRHNVPIFRDGLSVAQFLDKTSLIHKKLLRRRGPGGSGPGGADPAARPRRHGLSKWQNVPKISGTFCPFCQKNLGRTVRPEGIFCPRDILSQGPFCSRGVPTRDVTS
jgi:hypothetical protein